MAIEDGPLIIHRMIPDGDLACRKTEVEHPSS